MQSNPTKTESPPKANSSYGEILHSSSIIGGAQVISYIIAMIRTKLVAVLLGPSGVGLVGLYTSITGLVTTITQLGLDQSGVREVAEANGGSDLNRVASVTKTLRRACWFSGIVGWVLTVTLAWPISQWTFGSTERTTAVAILGITVFLGTLTGCQTALIQGMRRIKDIAHIHILSSLVTTFVAIAIYAWLRKEGIVPVIIATSAIQLGFAWFFSRRIRLPNINQTWAESARQSKRLIALGTAFMYGALLAAIVGVMIRSLIVRELGLDANGIYQAAWGLSGLFAGFILGAMSTDFYPRLTAAAHNDKEVIRLVNEQSEIGILLALPGLFCTLTFAPWMMHIFYSPKFIQGATLLPWFVVGVFGQVISWPLGMIQMAKGAKRWIYLSRTHGNLVWLTLTWILVKTNGIEGVAWAFAAYIWIQNGLVFWIARKLCKFNWSADVLKMASIAIILGIINFGIRWCLPGTLGLLISFPITLIACYISVRGIARRLGPQHRLIHALHRLPFLKFICRT